MPAHGGFGFYISLLPSVTAATFSVWLKETYLIFPKEAVNEIMFLPNSCVTGLDGLFKSSALTQSETHHPLWLKEMVQWQT